MKGLRAIILAAFLAAALSACAPQDRPADPNASLAPSENLIILEAGAWPENEYTDGLPVPPGEVADGLVDSENRFCSIQLCGMTDDEFIEYAETLRRAGFEEIQRVSEEIEGQGYVSTGLLMSDGQRGLSIAYIPGVLGIRICFEP